MSVPGPHTNTARRGTAATELAVCLPVIVLILLGTIESCTMIFLKQSLSVAAYEAARTGLRATATDADILAAANQVLSDRQVQGASITVNPQNIDGLAPGTYFTVTVTAPCNANAILPTRFFRDDSLSASATFMKELQADSGILGRIGGAIAHWIAPARGETVPNAAFRTAAADSASTSRLAAFRAGV